MIEYTNDFVYLNDGEIAVIPRRGHMKLTTAENELCKIDISKLQLSISQLGKGGYDHFMLKEIFE